MNQCDTNAETSGQAPARYRCPVNGHEYARVKIKTLLHHLENPWELGLTEQPYYFCDDPECDVVYFGQDDSVFEKHRVRTRVWQKEADPDANVCYCFGVSQKQSQSNEAIREFITQQTKQGNCACESRNPSGRCCLKDFATK